MGHCHKGTPVRNSLISQNCRNDPFLQLANCRNDPFLQLGKIKSLSSWVIVELRK